MVKKYIYISILLGAFALTGCTDDKADNKEEAEVEEAAPILLNLTEEQKENYYNQYLEIFEEIIADYPSANMELKPFEEFIDEDWIEPEVFRERLIDVLENGAVYD